MEYVPEATGTGWIVDVEGDLTVEIDHAELSKGGVIRAMLTVRRETAVIHRDTVNLMSERERQKLIKRLAAKSVKLDAKK